MFINFLESIDPDQSGDQMDSATEMTFRYLKHAPLTMILPLMRS